MISLIILGSAYNLNSGPFGHQGLALITWHGAAANVVWLRKFIWIRVIRVTRLKRLMFGEGAVRDETATKSELVMSTGRIRHWQWPNVKLAAILCTNRGDKTLGKHSDRKVAVVPTINVRKRHAAIMVTTCKPIKSTSGTRALESKDNQQRDLFVASDGASNALDIVLSWHVDNTLLFS